MSEQAAAEVVEIVRAEPAPQQGGQLAVGPPGAGEWQVLTQQATAIAKTEFVPPALRGKPEAVLAAILTGRELGIGPMQALQGITMIDGKPALSAELQRALVQRRGHYIAIDPASDGTRATVHGRRRDTGQQDKATWTIQDAERAGLVQIVDGKPQARSRNNNPLPWETYTRQMLVARATSELVSRLFADVLAGVSYTVDEVSDGQWTASDDVGGEPGDVVGGDPAGERRVITDRIRQIGDKPLRETVYRALYGERQWAEITNAEAAAYLAALERAAVAPQAATEAPEAESPDTRPEEAPEGVQGLVAAILDKADAVGWTPHHFADALGDAPASWDELRMVLEALEPAELEAILSQVGEEGSE